MTSETTQLDLARAAMAAAPEDPSAGLRFYERLAESELFLLLAAESDGESIEPQVFPLETGQVVLVFDREARLTDFLGGPADYAAMSGRQVVRMLVGQGIGLGVNFGVEASEIALPAEAVTWLAEMLDNRPDEVEERPQDLSPPGAVPDALLQGLDEKLAIAAGRARFAYLAGVTYDGGRRAHLLAFIDPAPGAEGSLAAAVGEALTFSGLDAGSLDVAFFEASDPMAAGLARVGLRIDLPEPDRPEVVEISPPGMDPEDPPILR